MENPQTREIIRGIAQITEKISKAKKTKPFWKKLKYMFIATILFTIIVKFFFMSPTNNEIVTHINTPSFPLDDLSINLPNDIHIDCEIEFSNNNNPYICPKNKKKINIKELIKKDIIIKEGEYMVISFFVKDNNYIKMQDKILKINYNIYSFDNKYYKINKLNTGVNYRLDSMIKTSNERKETKCFYYGIKSHTINNDGESQDFSILNTDERVGYFSWDNPYFTKKGCNFQIFLTKENFYLLTERKSTNVLIIILVVFSVVNSIFDVFGIGIREKTEKETENKNENNNENNNDSLLTNERRQDNVNNNGINFELEEI